MKKANVLALTGFLFMFLKGNLFLIESSLLYITTNIIGAILLLASISENHKKLKLPIAIYAGLSLLVYLLSYFQGGVLPIVSGLFLLPDLLVFLFPIGAFLYYINSLSNDERLINIADKLIKFSLGLSLVASFILLTGILFAYSLSAISIIVVMVFILEIVSLLLVFLQFSRDSQYASNEK